MNVGKEYSSPGKLSCGVPQGSILGPLLFLLYVNDMPQAVNSELLLYADDTCLIYTAKDTKTIEEQLNSDFNSLCEWFIDNKLSIHFGVHFGPFWLTGFSLFWTILVNCVHFDPFWLTRFSLFLVNCSHLVDFS